jgi:hypothetical protein
MRAVVLIAGLVLSAASAAAAQPSVGKPACEKPATLMGALSGLFGRSACRAPEAGTPGAGPAIGPPSRPGPEPAQAADHTAPARLATTTCREALPLYDAGGQATYLPSRACGRY